MLLCSSIKLPYPTSNSEPGYLNLHSLSQHSSLSVADCLHATSHSHSLSPHARTHIFLSLFPIKRCSACVSYFYGIAHPLRTSKRSCTWLFFAFNISLFFCSLYSQTHTHTCALTRKHTSTLVHSHTNTHLHTLTHSLSSRISAECVSVRACEWEGECVRSPFFSFWACIRPKYLKISLQTLPFSFAQFLFQHFNFVYQVVALIPSLFKQLKSSHVLKT